MNAIHWIALITLSIIGTNIASAESKAPRNSFRIAVEVRGDDALFIEDVEFSPEQVYAVLIACSKMSPDIKLQILTEADSSIEIIRRIVATAEEFGIDEVQYGAKVREE
ncbi:MAG: hypothetical protein P1U86_08340 [Verrucomicrobiales bacterium]|nr:hypothetical protein [Verrucomicrobiales bacterium]